MANCTSIWPHELHVFENLNMVPKYQCLIRFEDTIPPSIYNGSGCPLHLILSCALVAKIQILLNMHLLVPTISG
jgi:hypothetical protein